MNNVSDKYLSPPDVTREELQRWFRSALNSLSDVQTFGEMLLSQREQEELEDVLTKLEWFCEERED